MFASLSSFNTHFLGLFMAPVFKGRMDGGNIIKNRNHKGFKEKVNTRKEGCCLRFSVF